MSRYVKLRNAPQDASRLVRREDSVRFDRLEQRALGSR